MPPWRQRGAQQVEVRSFEWAEAGPGVVLLRLVAGTDLDVAGAEPELLVTSSAGSEQRLPPLPAPAGQVNELRVAFPVEAALVDDPETRFELVLDDVPSVALPFPEAMGPPPPTDSDTGPGAHPGELELESAVLARKLARLREELHDARRQLGEAEIRAEDAYANQVMAEDRSFEARLRASHVATRLVQVEASLADAHTQVSELRLEREALTQQVAGLEREGETRERARQQAVAEATAARAELANLRERAAAELEDAREGVAAIAGLERELATARDAVAVERAERARLEADLAEALERAVAGEREEAVATEPVAHDDEAERLRIELELIQESAVRMEAELQRTAADAANARAQSRAVEDELRATKRRSAR